MDNRSPLDNIFGIIGSLPQGHDKPVKHALYNAVALLLLCLCCVAVWALFMILEPFIKPLIWALLVGSALHPLKRSLRDKFQNWFVSLEESHTPIVLGVILLPINIVNDFSDFIGDHLWKRLKFILVLAVAIPAGLILYNYTPRVVICIFYKIYMYNSLFLNFFLDHITLSMVSCALVCYLTVIFFFWKPENNTKFHYASIGIWLLLSCTLSHQFGIFQLPVFISLQFIFFGGFLNEVYDIHSDLNSSGQSITFLQSLSLVFNDRPPDSIEESEDTTKRSPSTEKFLEHVEGENVPPKNRSSDVLDDTNKPKFDKLRTNVIFTKEAVIAQKRREKIFKRSLSQPQFSQSIARLKGRSSLFNLAGRISFDNATENAPDAEKYESTFYLYSVFWACIVMFLWKNVFLLPLLPLPLLLYCAKHAGKYFGLWVWLRKSLAVIVDSIRTWCRERHDALVPIPIRGLYRVVFKVNGFLKNSIRNSIDTVASCCVIVGLIVFLVCASIIIALQIYAEAIMMVQMTGNVINQTVVHNPELRQLLPPAWDDTVDSILDNAYQYGREGISKTVKSVMSDVDSIKSAKLEKQVLELWDRIYQSWMSTDDSNGPKVTPDAIRMSWDNFMTDIQRSPELFNFQGIVDFGKQNLGTLLSLLESVWSILKGNLGLILSSCSTLLSVILGGGTAVLNFILNGIVFLTTLFYLLGCSGDVYKPVELMTKFSSSSRRFGHALEAAVNGVFTASLKMAVFYGLWTWLIHNLFGVKIVYLPSAFAMILGAVPFLGTYWACFPAVLDLWLAQDRGFEAILFALFQFLPTSIVDTTIYTEIKGGHPYLTGLAIAGGIFCVGVEGAIIGPLLLCGLYVAIDLSSSLFTETPSTESINLRLQLQDAL